MGPCGIPVALGSKASPTPYWSPWRRARHGLGGARALRARGGPLARDDVVDLERLWLARIDPDVGEKGHEALAECAELLLRVPHLADSHLPIREKAHMQL